MPPAPEVTGFWRRHKIAIWLLVVPAGVVMCAYIASRQTDDGPRQISIFACVLAATGFVISYAKFVYDIWDEEKDRTKKSAENIEAVRASITYIENQRGDTKLGLAIYNTRMTDVNIMQVVLFVIHNGRQYYTEMSYPTGEV